MKYLTFEQLIRLNQRTVEAHGGNFLPPHNLLHEEALRYLIEAVSGEMFGEPIYPTIADKAAVYCYSIISNHVFQDGNKRTGIGAALAFLALNEYRIEATDELKPLPNDRTFPSSDEQLIYNFTLEVASGKFTLDEVRAWFRNCTSEK